MKRIFDFLENIPERLVSLCREKGIKIACAESCTGGLISAMITGVSGSSEVFEYGICSYSNEIKKNELSVSEKTLAEKSEYSKECALEMARGARENAKADFAVSTSGVAGPSGGSAKNPVGTVYIGVSGKNGETAKRFYFDGKNSFGLSERDYIRLCAAKQALAELMKMIKGEK